MDNNRPKFRAALIDPSDNVTIGALLLDGLTVPGVMGKLTVYFKTVGKPFRPRKGSGFEAIRVKSDFGGFTTLFYEPGTKQVSGLVWVRK